MAPKPEYRQNHFTEFRASAQYQQSMIEWVEGIEGSEAGLQAQITDNADNIATNTTNIGQNASNIATNTDNIESNTNARTEYNAKFDSILAGDYWDGASVVTTGNWQFGDIQSTGGIFGDPGFESGGIDIGGTIFNSTLKVSDIGGTNPAQTILHRHSTTLPPAIIGARSHSNTSTHAIVVDGDNLLDIFAVGWDGNNYKIAASIRMEVDGVPGSNDMPGRIVLSTTAYGGITLIDAAIIDSDQLLKLTNDLEVTEGGTGASTAGDARTNLNVDVAGTDNSTNVSLAGTPNYITIVGQVITRALINLTSHITGILPLANGGTNDAAVTSANIGHLKAMDQDVAIASNVSFGTGTFGGAVSSGANTISSGSAAISTTPSGYGVLQSGTGILQGADTNDNTSLANNAYFNGANWEYIITDKASRLQQTGGVIKYQTAISGTAGGTVTWVDNFDVQENGNATFSGTIDTTDTTDATSTILAALLSAGGLGVAKSAVIGGTLTVDDVFHVTGPGNVAAVVESLLTTAFMELRSSASTSNSVKLGAQGDNLIMRTLNVTRVTINSSGEVFLNLPTSAGTTGSLWNDSGTVKVA